MAVKNQTIIMCTYMSTLVHVHFYDCLDIMAYSLIGDVVFLGIMCQMRRLYNSIPLPLPWSS